MAFSTQRGRPRAPEKPSTDFGTPELRLKHALRLTAEPIDLCLERNAITEAQHWCGLHLRWLYTLRYGAPSITTHYINRDTTPAAAAEDPIWRALREQEYTDAAHLLKTRHHYERVMRLAVFNELPAFLSAHMRHQAHHNHALSKTMAQQREQLREGLELLVTHWQRRPTYT